MDSTRTKSIPLFHHVPFILILYFLAFVIVFERPLDVQQWQWADDALFYNNAKAIISHFGESPWLGPFTDVLLAKPPFFPLFIAVSISSGIPLRLLEFLLYAPLPFFFILAVRPLKLPTFPLLCISIFCFLFIPAAGLKLLLNRTTVFGAMVLWALISLTALVVYGAMRQKKTWFWALLAGISIGCATTTRGEGIWLFGPALLAMGLLFCFYWQQKQRVKTFVVIFLFIGGYFIPLSAFSTLNYYSYGIFSPSLRQHQSYQKLYSLLASIESGEKFRYVPLATEAREVLYVLSPKFAELKPFLEGPLLDDLAKNADHHRINGWGKKLDIREYFVTNFEWALARSIFLSGRVTASSFVKFCDNTVQQVQFAVDSGKIKAGRKGFGVLPAVPISDLPRVMQATFRSIRVSFWPEGIARVYTIKQNPDLDVSSRWHASLATWPGILNVTTRRLPDIVFNNYLINLFKMSYGVVAVTAFIVLISILFRKDKRRELVLAAVMAVSVAGLFAFSLVMGVVDTIAFPTLHKAGSYNSMGQFPLHYLFLISGVVILHGIQIFWLSSEK